MKNFLFLFSILFFCLLQTDCSIEENFPFQNKEYVSFSLPQWPPEGLKEKEIPALVSWNVIITKTDSQECFSIPGTQKSLKISAQKNEPFSILAEPVLLLKEKNRTFTFFYPAGTVYPFSKQITWNHGFTAEILSRTIKLALQENSPRETKIFLKYFNWSRLCQTVDQKISGNENPWNYNISNIVSSILKENFSLTSLKTRNTVTVSENQLVSSLSDISYSRFMTENLKTPGQEKTFSADTDKISSFLIFKSGSGQFKNLLLEFKKDFSLILANTEIPL